MKIEKMEEVTLDISDLDKCYFALATLKALILNRYGPVVASRLFAKVALTKKTIAANKNLRLMVIYMRSGLTPGKLAAKLANQNKNLPREERYGPTGSINPAVLKKQIQREIGRMNADEDYLDRVQWEASISEDEPAEGRFTMQLSR
jgi:hypothetical protein